MTVAALRNALRRLGPEVQVILAQDAEGNDYYALDEVVLTEDGQHVVLFPEERPLDADDLF